MVSGWFLFGVGELSDVKRRPDFWAISSKRIAISSDAGRTAQNRARLLRNTFFIPGTQFIRNEIQALTDYLERGSGMPQRHVVRRGSLVELPEIRVCFHGLFQHVDRFCMPVVAAVELREQQEVLGCRSASLEGASEVPDG